MYAFYPVVNLDFHQIERYLSWKTDRLNEVVLIKNGILKINFNQVNEDHFNTEAYCAGQYEGLVKRDLVDFNSNNEFRNLNLNDGVFLKDIVCPLLKNGIIAIRINLNTRTILGLKHLSQTGLDLGKIIFYTNTLM